MNSKRSSRNGLTVLKAAGAVLLVLASTFLFTSIIRVNAQTVGFAYLITILLLAAFLGLAESLAASIAATVCLNYFFLPPVGTLTIADTQNWIALFAFLVTSLVASQLSARAKQRAMEAMNKQREMERLYALSRATMLTGNAQPVARQIAGEIARIYDFSAVAVYDRNRNEVHRAGPEDIGDVDVLLREAALTGSMLEIRDGVLVTAISLGGHSIGSVAPRETASSRSFTGESAFETGYLEPASASR